VELNIPFARLQDFYVRDDNMPKNDLPELTKIMHKSQEKWRHKNWNETLGKHKEEIEELLQKIRIFDIWSNALQDDAVAKALIPEIFMDAYISLHFAGYGLYKYAYVCLRSELETTLRLIFFSTHKVEYKWWSEGNEWYKENVTGDVWGRGYLYFQQLNTIKAFDKACGEGRRLFHSRKVGVGGIYGKLSGYIHSGAGHFQTRPDRVSPEYKLGEFRKWVETFKEVQEYINILLSLGFPNDFGQLSNANKEKIWKIGLESADYQKILGNVLPS